MKKYNKNSGFTLIEMLTALSVFAVVMTISIGSILSVFDTNRKSEALRAVMDNLNLAVESMSREMRFGTNYYCGVSTPLSGTQNCSFGGHAVTFRAANGSTVVYKLDDAGTGLEKSVDGGTYIPVTAQEIEINDLTFYVLGTGSQTPEQQPRVLIKIKGTAGVKDVDRTEFTVQTLVSQRILDR